MKTEKEFSLVYLDRGGNELQVITITARNKKEANNQRKIAFSNNMINDCKRIILR